MFQAGFSNAFRASFSRVSIPLIPRFGETIQQQQVEEFVVGALMEMKELSVGGEQQDSNSYRIFTTPCLIVAVHL